MLSAFINLMIGTLSQPRDAAAEILSIRPNRSVMWSALVLAVLLNTMVYQISLFASPPQVALPVIFSSPIIFAILIGSGLVLSIYSITYAGRFIGGRAVLDDVMALLIWLQFLRFAVQLAAFLLMPIIPGIAGLLILCATLYGMWLLLQFVDVAHGFENLLTSFFALILSGLGIVLGLAILLSLLGVQNMGLTPYV
ncbi:MAG: YIP1 family protein [Planktotalea sp.]|jgi:hypothetical protein|uniref:YIP1 family protein n=1 Tax=Planktotalea sp. TaxID=2029877 RepID=UPI0002E448A0|nr:YIP1 family protein [Planktotalea sp.]MBT5823496.1 YIP1 family protein [Paracoccaceae bacterium]MDG1076509.1 YIP1 family protein [Planktotalea sp.]MDG1083559.1 YIP1 family protein [Planktotalea sp.]HCW83422.1 YIP1 family protein [Paracoccaceae bacterium]